jgi:endonuclease/exonuclease/phosphatase family metal-dependent hydrolase
MMLVAAALLALLVIPVGMALAGSGANRRGAGGSSLRVMSYNVHLGIDGDGQLSPEALAGVIERQRPAVVCLQEVVRGWPGTGGIDLAEWLSHRLGMAFAFAPAADGQFGNVVLSRLSIHDPLAVPLPKVNAPMGRSYLVATLELTGGRPLTVIDAHLEGAQPGHRAQSEALVARWGHGSSTVIAGDMNMQPSDSDVAIFEGAGLISAQDRAGQGSQSSATHPTSPGDRPDWIFGSPDLVFSDFDIGRSSPSDHRPLTVAVTLG